MSSRSDDPRAEAGASGAYPPRDPARERRVGAAVLAVVALLLLGAALRQAASRDFGDWRPPLHPSALAAPESSRSRLLGWRAWSYPASASPDAIGSFHQQTLAAQGWKPVEESSDADGWSGRFRRGGWRLDVRARGEDGETRVSLLLTAARSRR